MGNNINAYCSICGKGYHVCASCSDAKTLTPWRTIVDTIDHYKIFMIIRDYTNKYIDIKEAKELLSKCDLSEYKTFEKEIKEAIEKITNYSIEENEEKIEINHSNEKEKIKNINAKTKKL